MDLPNLDKAIGIAVQVQTLAAIGTDQHGLRLQAPALDRLFVQVDLDATRAHAQVQGAAVGEHKAALGGFVNFNLKINYYSQALI